MKIIIS